MSSNHAITLESIDPSAGSGGDDTDILSQAITRALNNRTHVQLAGKTYNFDQPFTENRNSVRVVGCGAPTNRQDINQGSVLNSRISSGSGFYLAGVQSSWSHLGFTGSMNGWVVESWINQFSEIEHVHVETLGANTNGMVVREPFTCTYSDIDIWNGTENKQNIGFWHDTTVGAAGGLAKFENITASYFRQNMEFGQEKRFSIDPRKSNTISHCQGRFGVTGVRIGSGYLNVDVDNLWGESNSYAQIQIHSGAGPVCIEGILANTTQPGIGLALGLDPALATGSNDPIQGVTVKGGRLRSRIGGSTVRIFAPNTIIPDQWHEFDQVQMWPQTSVASQRIVVDPIAQMPVLVKRPMNRAVTSNNTLMTTPIGEVYDIPLILQTTP